MKTPTATCRLCDAGQVEILINFGMQPIVHALLASREQAAELYPFRLASCPSCGFLQLVDFIRPEILYRRYFTLSGWKRQPHEARLLELVGELFHLDPGARILEIGCNDGSFMEKLRSRGFTNLRGIEPSEDAFEAARAKGLDVLNVFFCGDLVRGQFSSEPRFDLVVTRQVLEHIGDLTDFMQSIGEVLKDHGGLLIEVPDHSMNLEQLDYSLWEEHVNYFTRNSLQNLCRRNGFDIVHYETTLFSGKAMIIFATKSQERKSTIRNVDGTAIENYGKCWPKFKKGMRDYLEERGGRAYVYGCGARSSTIVNFLDVSDLVECYIDDRKEKQGLYVPKSLLKVRPYEEVDVRGATVALGVNAENEWRLILKRQLAKTAARIASVLPPSKLLPEFWRRMANDTQAL